MVYQFHIMLICAKGGGWHQENEKGERGRTLQSPPIDIVVDAAVAIALAAVVVMLAMLLVVLVVIAMLMSILGVAVTEGAWGGGSGQKEERSPAVKPAFLFFGLACGRFRVVPERREGSRKNPNGFDGARGRVVEEYRGERTNTGRKAATKGNVKVKHVEAQSICIWVISR